MTSAKQKPTFITDRVTLKSFKLNNSMSEETPCYSATVYVDGVKAGTTANRGHGGCDEERFTPEGRAALEAIAKEIGEEVMDDVEVLLHTLVWEMQRVKDAQAMKRKGFPITVFIDDGTYMESVTGVRSSSDIAGLLAEFPSLKSYRVIGEDFPVKAYKTLAAFCAAHLAAPLKRGKPLSIATDDNGATVSFITGGKQHKFTDAAYAGATKPNSLFDAVCAERRVQWANKQS